MLGYPVGGVGGVGGTKPGRCPGILGLGIGQPEGKITRKSIFIYPVLKGLF